MVPKIQMSYFATYVHLLEIKAAASSKMLMTPNKHITKYMRSFHLKLFSYQSVDHVLNVPK